MKTISILAAAACMALAGGSPALADPPNTREPSAAAPANPEPGGRRTPMNEARLETYSAGEGVSYEVRAGQLLTATSQGNSVKVDGDLVSGDIDFSDAGFTGVGNFVANSGNNSNLQGSVMVNIVGAPPTQ